MQGGRDKESPQEGGDKGSRRDADRDKNSKRDAGGDKGPKQEGGDGNLTQTDKDKAQKTKMTRTWAKMSDKNHLGQEQIVIKGDAANN